MYPDVAQRIEIYIGEDGSLKKLYATVLDVIDNGIIINYPIDTSTQKVHFLLNDTNCYVVFIKNIDESKGLYKFKTKVVKKRNGHIPCIILSKPSLNFI
jgi:c-di-GMP-binding flagellar brake protein YcgR